MNFYCFQVLVLGNTFTLEQRLQLADQQVQGSSSLHNLLIHNKGESMMLNLVLPLCLKIGCGNKDDPRLRKTDIQFVLNLLLNMINPHKKINTRGHATHVSGKFNYHIQLASLIPERSSIYGMIRGYFDLRKIALKVMQSLGGSGSKQILIGSFK